MTRYILGAFWAKITLVFLFAAMTSMVSLAQSDVEIEIAGPWSYVLDPTDSRRVVIVAPQGHTMAVFTGDDVSQYSSISGTPLGSHRLDFSTLSCGPALTPSSFFLYPANGVSQHNIQNALSSNSAFSISLPKPCSYESQSESVFKYHGIRPATPNDPERSFTTSMTLHYKVAATTTGAVLDNAIGKPVLFGSNSGTAKHAISVVLYLDTAPDMACDSHSATAFDSTLTLWGIAHFYRIFPQLSFTPGTNYNKQIPGSYTPTCSQTLAVSSTAMANNSHSNAKQAQKSAITEKEGPRSPGRADCHAAQVNVNGAVN